MSEATQLAKSLNISEKEAAKLIREGKVPAALLQQDKPAQSLRELIKGLNKE